MLRAAGNLKLQAVIRDFSDAVKKGARRGAKSNLADNR